MRLNPKYWIIKLWVPALSTLIAPELDPTFPKSGEPSSRLTEVDWPPPSSQLTALSRKWSRCHLEVRIQFWITTSKTESSIQWTWSHPKPLLMELLQTLDQPSSSHANKLLTSALGRSFLVRRTFLAVLKSAIILPSILPSTPSRKKVFAERL